MAKDGERKLTHAEKLQAIVDKPDKGPGLLDRLEDTELNPDLYVISMIIQKLEVWRTILKRVKADPSLSRDQLEDIRTRIGKMWDVINQAHGHTKWSDEIISIVYYGITDELEQLELYLKQLKLYLKNDDRVLDLFIEDERVRVILEGLPFDSKIITLRDKAKNATRSIKLHLLAREFTARWSGLSQDQVRKKIKRIYE